MKFGIICAMANELEGIKSSIAECHAVSCAHLTVYEGKLEGVPVAAVQCGVGKVNAAITTQLLITCCGVTHVINSGVAGGLDKRLSVMDMVVSTKAVHHDFDITAWNYVPGLVPGFESPYYEADAHLQKAVEAAYAAGQADGSIKHKLISGVVASGDQFINDPVKKEWLISTFNGACCEMEGASIAHVCAINKVPFVILRCISDMAENADEVYEEDRAAAESGYVCCATIKELAKTLA